jgi:hypothetical protein
MVVFEAAYVYLSSARMNLVDVLDNDRQVLNQRGSTSTSCPMSIQPNNDGLFARIRRVFAVLGFLYLGAVILLTVPWFQSQ